MYKILWNASALAVGSAGAVVSYQKFFKFHQKHVFAESLEESVIPRDQISSDLDLELKQVQVFFRHGARTPLHVLEGFEQVPYDVDLVMRPHPLTLFPYERVSWSTGLPCEWSSYEKSLQRKPLLRGGAIPGHLTSFGQDQLYNLGLQIRNEYSQQLGINQYDPKILFVLSTNICRTVESARCVIAGIYGKDELERSALQYGPLKIPVCDLSYNILIPDTRTCSVLSKVNHSALLHFDFVESMKVDRERVEKHIDDLHDTQQDNVAKVQDKMNKLLESQQPHPKDKQLLSSVIKDRDVAIAEVADFWHNAISHHPGLGKLIPTEELRALQYLQKLEVEEIQSKFKTGYRFRLHFDSCNPYFYNKVICKEVYKQSNGGLVSVQSTGIEWKEGKRLGIQNKSDKENEENGISFFSWISEQNVQDSDSLGDSLKEVWRNPLSFYRHVSYKMDHSTTKKINFVFLYDDLRARQAHGWQHPKEIEQFWPMAVKNGTRMMFYAMTGRHKRERPMVTSLAVGRLLHDMVERAEGAMTGKNPQKLCLYSSHDSTMVSLLESLGLWQHTWPPFGCDLRLEVYQDRKSSQFYLRVLYLGEAVKLRGQTSEMIPWEEFKKVVDPYMMEQERFQQICASNFLEEIAKDVLKHEEGELTEGEESKTISDTPAGM